MAKKRANGEGNIRLITGSGLYQGETVVFVDGKAYSLSQIMAIGKIPEDFIKDETVDKDETTDKDDTTTDDKTDNTEEVKPEA